MYCVPKLSGVFVANGRSVNEVLLRFEPEALQIWLPVVSVPLFHVEMDAV